MSTTFEFTQAEIKKPSPPITSILDFINGDGSDGVAHIEETTREENFHSLVPIEPESTTPMLDLGIDIGIDIAPPWKADSVEPSPDLIDAIKFSTENELIAHWLKVHGFDDSPITEQAFAQATDWAKSFLSETSGQESTPVALDFEFVMSESIDPGFETNTSFFETIPSVIDANTTQTETPTDYSKLYQDAIDKWKEDCFRAESDHKTRLEKLKKDQTEAAIAIEKAGEVVKQTKKVHKAIMLRLMNALDSGATFPDRPSMPDIVKLAKESEPAESVEVTKEIAADGTVTVKKANVNQDTTWRTIATTTVLDAVKDGLGPKKREALTDSFPTLGHLEDARGKASVAYKNFSEFLPEGIGKELAGRIEDAMMDAIGKHSTDLGGI